jgi:hypothetical protein
MQACPIDSIGAETRSRPAVPENHPRVRVAGAGGKVAARSLVRILGDDVDDAIHSVRSPDGSTRTADYLDAIDVSQSYVLRIPVHSGKGGDVNRAAIHQDKELIRVLPIEAASCDRPLARVDLSYIQPGNHAQKIGNVECTGASNIVP